MLFVNENIFIAALFLSSAMISLRAIIDKVKDIQEMEKQLLDSKTSFEAMVNVDCFMEQLPRKVYEDGWPEDKWEKEMEKHPFFMTKSPEPGEELHPLIEGLQKLKYDEEENSPEELANTYKESGNFCFKCKKYRDAITNFSVGLKLECSDELRAQLLNNRAAANFFIENYKSALIDSIDAVKLNSNYLKAKLRVCRCYYHLEKYEECIKICEEIISEDQNNSAIIQLKKDAITKKKVKYRNLRKQAKEKKNKLAEEALLLEALKYRKINFHLRDNKELISIADLNPDLHIPEKMNRVYLENGTLFWPVLLSFTELTLNIPINDFEENCKFEVQLKIVFTESAELETKKYQLENVNIYFKDEYMKPIKFSVTSTLKEVLCDPRFILDCGIPVFFVLVKNSAAEENFINCIHK
ncbi:hypothetical protein PGB90_004119 [Kerria lacca]